MQNIIAFAGSKQSGKSSSVNFLHGHIMKKYGSVSYFDINDKGDLLVNAASQDENGNLVENEGILDISRRDYEFILYAQGSIWPNVKGYNFADRLKQAAIKIFGIDPKLVFGTNEEKNGKTSIKWCDLGFAFFPKEIEKMKKDGIYHDFMTGREFLQVFGTKVCRRIQDSCWIDRCIEDILAEECPLALIGDCRFPNEVEALKKIGAKVIKFTRKFDDDKDESETALDGYDNYDIVIDNQNITIHQKNIAVFDYLKSVGIVDGEI